MILYFIEFLFIFIVSIAALIFIVDLVIRSKGYKGQASDHFDGIKFLNIKDRKVEKEKRGSNSVLKWMFTRKKNEWETRAVTQVKPASKVEGGELVATLINHATVLLQTEGLNIITDPIYSERASPFTFAGPKRFTEPGVAFEDLPKIDSVLISHNHYDHLDIATLKRLVARDHPQIVVPLGNKVFLQKHGITGVVELDWWNIKEITADVSVTCVPAQHFSARGLSDRNKTLWSGHVITTPHGDMYFAGDTGFGPFVEQIAQKFPKGFRLGLLPIGAYRPEWFMKEVHISPDEAFKIQERLSIHAVLAIHFGTFKLADDTQDEPAQRVSELTSTHTSTRFLALPNGSSMQIK